MDERIIVKAAKQTFKTTDGATFDSRKEAESHQAFVDALSVFNRAQEKFNELLATQSKTADGQPFRFGWSIKYWYITKGFVGMPKLVEVSFENWRVEIDVDFLDERTVVLNQKPHHADEASKHVRYPISELFASKDAAARALIEKQTAWIQDRQNELDELIAVCENQSGESVR